MRTLATRTDVVSEDESLAALKAAQASLRLVEATLPLIEVGVRDSEISPEEHRALFDFLATLARQNPYG